MERKTFLKNIFGVSAMLALGGLGFMKAQGKSLEKEEHDINMQDMTSEVYATFGAVHLNNTSLEKATQFWTKIAGLKLRNSSTEMAEFGSENKTLVVVHQTAKTPFQEGYSGMYHVAIHAGSKAEFAKMLYRIMANNYPCSPTDHTMSKSVYLNDPDGITIEFALETPERFKRVITSGGLKIEGSDGVIRGASDTLDIDEVMKDLVDKDLNTIVSNDAKIGHIHFYAKDVEKSNAFYKQLGFEQFNYLPQFLYADVSAGGPYHHRVAMNSWHGRNRPLAPKDSAGLKHYHIVFDNKERLSVALKNISSYEEKEGGYWTSDPTGNVIFLTHA
jgi:catechol 2,3-dioxygenase